MTERLYFDHNASHPLRPAARRVLQEALEGHILGNPSSAHLEGRRARALLEESRERLAAVLGCTRDQLIFTSGGSESNCLALRAVSDAACVAGGATEHPSVLEALSQRPQHVLLHTDRSGQISAETVANLAGRSHAGDGDTPAIALVSVAWANHETGQLQDVASLATATHEMGGLFHSDACQALGRVPVSVAATGVDLLSVSAHKVGGPLGIGALVCAETARPRPAVVGGGQEDGLRAGTESAVLAAAFAAAAEQACEEREWLVGRWLTWKEQLRSQLKSVEPDAVFHSATADCLPNTLCVSFPGRPGPAMVQRLDLAGVSVSHGSACSSGSLQPSAVLTAMGAGPELASSSVRISMGRDTNSADVDGLLRALSEVLRLVPPRTAKRKTRAVDKQ